jgi:hypothetical protein
VVYVPSPNDPAAPLTLCILGGELPGQPPAPLPAVCSSPVAVLVNDSSPPPTWSQQAALPGYVTQGVAVSHGGRVYIIAGQRGAGDPNTTWASLGPGDGSGSITGWEQLLPPSDAGLARRLSAFDALSVGVARSHFGLANATVLLVGGGFDPADPNDPDSPRREVWATLDPANASAWLPLGVLPFSQFPLPQLAPDATTWYGELRGTVLDGVSPRLDRRLCPAALPANLSCSIQVREA